MFTEKSFEVRIESLKHEIEKHGDKLIDRIGRLEKKFVYKNETKQNINFEIFRGNISRRNIGICNFNLSSWSENNSEENNQKICFVDDDEMTVFMTFLNEVLNLN